MIWTAEFESRWEKGLVNRALKNRTKSAILSSGLKKNRAFATVENPRVNSVCVLRCVGSAKENSSGKPHRLAVTYTECS